VECTRTVSGFGCCRLPFETGRITPQTLESEVVTHGRLEDVHDHIPIVEQHPLGLATTFDPQRSPIHVAKLELDLVGKTLDVTVGGTRRDRKHVRDPQKLRHIQEDDIGGFLGIEYLRDEQCEFSTVDPVLDERSRLLCGNVLTNNDSDVHHAAGMANLDQHLSPAKHHPRVQGRLLMLSPL